MAESMADKSKAMKTRTRIMRAAEKIFAEKGFRAMTLRDVTKEARVNLAAVNYHFGSKANLMLAVIQQRFEPINAKRIERLEALIASYADRPIPPSDLFAALFEPLFQAAHASKNKSLMLIIGRAFTEPAEFMCQMHREVFKELCDRFMRELTRSCPHLSPDDLRYRFFFAVSTMLGTIVEQNRLYTITQTEEVADFSEICERMIRFVVAGFEPERK